MAEPLIITGAGKDFGPKRALHEVSIEVPAESLCVLLGPSGSGKTTLLRCIAGIERLDRGSIQIGSRCVASPRLHLPPESRSLSMVFQDYALWPHLSAKKNVQFALDRHRITKQRSSSLALAMLERVGLGEKASQFPSELSGGEQQRVALARALVAETGLLLFDEPLSNLDADLRERMRLEISTLVRQSQSTAVYITHDQSEAFALADQIGVMRSGQLIQMDTPENIYNQPIDPFVARFTGLAGELPVKVIGSEQGLLRLEVDGVPSDLRILVGISPLLGGRETLGRAGTAMIRPGAVKLRDPTDPESCLRGLVTDSAYRGRGYDHAISLENGTSLIGVHSHLRQKPGAAVGLSIRPQGCLVFAPTPDVRLPEPQPENLIKQKAEIS